MIPPCVGAFGKVPTQRDFVRVLASDLLASGADKWLTESATAMKRAGASLPSDTSVVFATASTVIVGALVDSADAVGREHPLWVFTTLDPALASRSLAALPAACGAFVSAARAYARRAPSMDFAQWCAGLASLPQPSALTWSRAEALAARALTEARGAGLHGLFSGGQHYAFESVMRACAGQAGREPPPRASATLDGPTAQEADRALWLDLCSKLLRWRTPPSLLWNDAPASKVLIALGPLPTTALTYLTQPDARDDRLWPLRPSRPDAATAAAARLADPLRAALDSPATPYATLVSLARP